MFGVWCAILLFYKALEQEVVNELEAAGMETKVVKRYQYNDEVVKWADLVVTTGFLLLHILDLTFKTQTMKMLLFGSCHIRVHLV